MKKQYLLRLYTSSNSLDLLTVEVSEKEFFRVITTVRCDNSAVYPQIMPINTIVISVICENLQLSDIKYKRIVS